ncbi:MAG: NADH-quinone oxidoreductase subunit G [Neisseriaceae bacterium]|jgi:NADH-quinone oxidoreductase subunit G|nr:MAG: NADH-quinone oxidoreductase subunit G [Neisseriaceae bacterium]
MIEFELDGKTVKGEPGASVLEVALQEGKYIPHFCYHKKLSIAANCRMCLVEVEKARGPVPACATPITEGMKVHTCSKLAVEAQKGVMEFLLINHPLDCPICDQGGECQLQDLAVGYGRGSSRFEEEKRAVVDKDLGPLVKTTMTRCIHCSRCVRFTDEIAGYQELGMSYRNNHVEVMPFIGKTVNSEISGNIIDICPVGALTSKPFRDTARSWELSRRKSVSPHDGLGSNIQVHIDKYHKVVRVLPLDNEKINECWISDRDRFSYEGLYHAERATDPMIKQNNEWVKVDWETAIEYAAKSINGVKIDHGNDAIATLASASSTTEELYLLQKLMRALGVSNIDYRLNQQDFALDGSQNGVQYLGCSIDELVNKKSLLLVGSVIREEQPVLAAKIRRAVKSHDMHLHSINVVKDELLTDVKTQVTVDPRNIAFVLAKILKSVVAKSNQSTDVDLSKVQTCAHSEQIAQCLLENKGHIALGRVVVGLSDFSNVVKLANEISRLTQGSFGFISSLANEVGAQLVGFVPHKTAFNGSGARGMNVSQMLNSAARAYVLLNTELEHDVYSSQQALATLSKADTVVVMSAYVNENMLQYADVILPVTTYTETAGSYVNMDGTWQKFNGVTKPYANSKPAWKVIRVLANRLAIDGFEQNSIEDVRNELSNLTDISKYLNNSVSSAKIDGINQANDEFVRFGIYPIYQADSIVRRAKSLQETVLANLPTLAMSGNSAKKIGANDGAEVIVSQTHARKAFKLAICDDIADNVVLLARNNDTVGFAGNFDAISIETVKGA